MWLFESPFIKIACLQYRKCAIAQGPTVVAHHMNVCVCAYVKIACYSHSEVSGTVAEEGVTIKDQIIGTHLSPKTHPSKNTNAHTWWFILLSLRCAGGGVLCTCISVNVRLCTFFIVSSRQRLPFFFRGHYAITARIHSPTLCVASPFDDTPQWTHKQLSLGRSV